jgi:tRNA threonylcarbamoyladenosine biosynthesis protein TsaE
MSRPGEYFLQGEAETLEFGRSLARSVRAGEKIFLHGDLGAGKTTLVRGFLHELGHQGAVKSPTYSLVEHYYYKNMRIYHFDLYRLGDPEELEYMGIRDYFGGRNVCLVEWAERGRGILPQADLDIRIIYEGASHRRIHVEAHTPDGRELMRRLDDMAGPYHARKTDE